MSEERRELAWKAHREGDLQQAEGHYRALLEQGPQADDAVNLGAMLRKQGRLREAGQHYTTWLPRFPDALQLHLNAANCLHDLNDHGVCVALMRGYLQRHPQERKVQWALARSLTELREHEEAEQLLRQLTRTDRNDVSSWLDLGLCLYRQEKRAEALHCFEQVSALEPQDTKALSNRITMLKDAGRIEECRALVDGLEPTLRNDPMVRGAIATMHMASTDMKAALQDLVPLCNDEPCQDGHWLNLASSLRSLKHANAALEVLKQGLIWNPEATGLQQALGQCLAELGQPEKALPVLRRSAGAMESIKDEYLFNLQFLGAGYHLISPAELQRWARAWEARLQQERGVGALWADVVREPLQQRRLRVGYLCADWCNHPVCHFMLPVLQHHDRSQVEVWGLCSTPHHDKTRELAQASCEHWLDLRHATDLEAARVIADLKLDVLVELGGYTGHSRLAALVHRAAPVQLSYLGYFAPTFLKTVDGWIGDPTLFADLDPVEAKAHRLWLVEGGYMDYAPPAGLPKVARGESARFRFGCFNHSRKLNPATVGLFAAVLRAVPDSELVVKSISFIEAAEQQRMRWMLEAAGVESQRLIVLEASGSPAEHLAMYKEMDVALDPIPYGGATTSCEALVMGVPVLALAGAGMVGRLSSSVLASAGLEEWICADETSYVALAKALAEQGFRGVTERERLRQQVLASSLCEQGRVSRELERIYQEACLASAVE